MSRTLTLAFIPALLVILLAGCSATITPPSVVEDPVTVYVIDHGRHSSLVLPTEHGAVRYSYGDWDYYALRKTNWWNALYALLYPSPSALGRQELALQPNPENLPGQLRMEVTHILPIAVESAAVEALYRELENAFLSAIATRHYSDVFDTDFVHYPRRYTLRHNSNRKVADWLEQLGCDIAGTPLLSRWRIATTEPTAP